ncbi:MAG TPA: hypothetical protein P5107_08315 [Thermotogota bacterium]|nr:hypothetical protein [Thermotogota bacterium]HRW35046.1 hypothetical protein [Thermotogota bacterium]
MKRGQTRYWPEPPMSPLSLNVCLFVFQFIATITTDSLKKVEMIETNSLKKEDSKNW